MNTTRKAFVGLAVLGAMMVASPAFASGTINWTGHGSDNLPCDNGGHWVLAPAFGINSAVLIVDGVSTVMTQNGNGSWAADSSVAVDDQTTASVTYTGPGDERDHLQLSHCLAGESPTPTPTETPSPSTSPSESPTPTNTPSPTGTKTKSPSGAHHTPTLHQGPRPSATKPGEKTAMTGSNKIEAAIAAAVGLGLLGLWALRKGSKSGI